MTVGTEKLAEGGWKRGGPTACREFDRGGCAWCACCRLPERKFDQGDVTVTNALIKETSVALDTV